MNKATHQQKKNGWLYGWRAYWQNWTLDGTWHGADAQPFCDPKTAVDGWELAASVALWSMHLQPIAGASPKLKATRESFNQFCPYK